MQLITPMDKNKVVVVRSPEVARNYFLSSTQTYIRKFTEILLPLKDGARTPVNTKLRSALCQTIYLVESRVMDFEAAATSLFTAKT